MVALRFTGLGGLSAAGVAATEGPHSSFLLQKFGHRAFAARFGPAEVFVNLKQAFARELGADIRGGERCTEESHRGGAKQTRVSRRRPCFHLLAEIGLRAFRHRTQHLKKKGAGAVESNQSRGGGQNPPVPTGVVIPKGVRKGAENFEKNIRIPPADRLDPTLPNEGISEAGESAYPTVGRVVRTSSPYFPAAWG